MKKLCGVWLGRTGKIYVFNERGVKLVTKTLAFRFKEGKKQWYKSGRPKHLKAGYKDVLDRMESSILRLRAERDHLKYLLKIERRAFSRRVRDNLAANPEEGHTLEDIESIVNYYRKKEEINYGSKRALRTGRKVD